VVTTTLGEPPSVRPRRSSGDRFITDPVSARSMWIGADLYTLVALRDLGYEPLGWDVVTLVDAERGTDGGADTLRTAWDAPLLEWDPYASVYINDYR
jgi:hypothetical protein